MKKFQAFLTANMAAQTALRTEILGFHRNTREYGEPPLAKLQADLLVLTREMDVRYMQEKLHA